MDVFHRCGCAGVGRGEGGCTGCRNSEHVDSHDIGAEADVSQAVAELDAAEQELADRMEGGWEEL